MKSNLWFIKGITKGIQTEKFPDTIPTELAPWSTSLTGSGEASCPTEAISNGKWNADKCIYCRRCFPNYKPTGKLPDVESDKKFGQFSKSFFIYPMDIGSCGACNVELNALSYPQYDLHRLGLFFTNTPRHADAIVIMGIYTDKMQGAFQAAYNAMPDPKTVVAMGACAISGGLLGKPPIADSVIKIPGCPPNPYAILDALLKVRGSK